MQRTPRRSRRRKKNKSSRFIVMLLITGLLAVGCGWLINRLIVQGYLFAPAIVRDDPGAVQPPDDPPEGDDEQPADDITESRLSTRSFSFYLLQMGAFRTADGAEALVQRLETEGYPGAYVKEDDLFKVFAGIYQQSEAAEAISQMLSQLGHEKGYARELSIPAGDFLVTGSMAPYFEQAKESLASIEDAFAQLLAATAVDQQTASDLQEQVDQAHERLSGLNPASELVPFHSALLNACAELLAAVNHLGTYLEQNDESDLLMANSSLMDFALDYRAAQTIVHDLLG